MKTPCYLLLGLIALNGSAQAATQEAVGSWVLTCPADAPCIMRLNQRFIDKAGVTGDLEVQARGKVLVPVIALRGLQADLLIAAAMTGKTHASMRFNNGHREPLDCSVTKIGYICAPNEDSTPKLAAALPTARSARVRVSVAIEGMKPLPEQEKAVTLSGTTEALARLRSLGPSQIPAPMTAEAAQSPAGMMAMADKILKLSGYPNGAAQLQSLIAKYRRQ